MKIQRVQLVNIGDIPALTVDFDDRQPLTVLKGVNGCGKSTVLSAIRRLLTGAFPDAHPTMDRFRRTKGTELASPSSLTIWFTTNTGAQVEITNRLDKSGWTLIENGGKPITGEAPVKQRRQELLGVDSEIMKRFGFVQQGTMRDVLFAQAAERMKALQKLIGVGEMPEAARASMLNVINAIEAPDLTNDVATARRSRDEVASQMQAVALDLQTAQHTMAGIDIKAVYDVLGRAQDAAAANGAIQVVDSNIAACGQRMVAAQTALDTATTNTTGWQAEVTRLAPLAAEARNALANLAAARTRFKQKTDAMVHLSNVVSQQPRLVGAAPEKTGNYAAYDQMVKDLPALNLVSTQAAKAANDYRRAVVGTCPVCKTQCQHCVDAAGGPRDPATQSRLDREALDADHASNAAALIVNSYNRDVQAWQATLASHQGAMSGWTRRHADAESMVRSFDDVPAAEPDASQEAAWGKAISDHDVAVTYTQRWGSDANTATQLLATYKDEHARKLLEREELVKSQQAAPSPELLASAQLNQRLHAEAEAKVKSLTSVAASTQAMFNSRSKELDDLELRQSRNARLREFKTRLENIRAVLHRDRLPAKVVAGYMSLLAARCNELLPEFGAGFLVYTKDTEFWVQKANGDEIPASDLSGGQACRWCVAFLLSVHALFASNLGLLTLDEPTDGLDEAGKTAFGEALSRFSDIVAQRSTQTFIATHEAALQENAECVIDVGELRKQQQVVN